jgi:hypothetical protein
MVRENIVRGMQNWKKKYVINLIYVKCRIKVVYNLNYIPTILRVQSRREIASVEYANNKMLNTTGIDV